MKNMSYFCILGLRKFAQTQTLAVILLTTVQTTNDRTKNKINNKHTNKLWTSKTNSK